MSPHPFLDHPPPIAFAHRGGALEAEENTLPTFERAIALGYTHVETDVQATRDGVAVIFHDATLKRMLGREARIDTVTWAELAQLRTPSGAQVPRLDEMLAACPALFFNLEVKADAAVEPMIQAIRRVNALDRVCVGSFASARTTRLRDALGPGLCWSPAHAGAARLLLAGWGLPLSVAFPVLQVPIRFRGLPVVTRRLIRAAHARRVQVHVWTVDDADTMGRLIDLGVDGIMTDRPSVLREVMQQRGLWPAE